MQNFLEVYADPKKIRALLESIHPIGVAQIKGELWTTTGEVDRFTNDGKQGAGQRINKNKLSFVEMPIWRIEDAEEARYLATQMGKPSNAFGAAMGMWKFINAAPLQVAFVAIVVHDSPRAQRVRDAVGLPKLTGVAMIEQIKQSILSGKPNPSWGFTREPALSPKSPIVAGELSGLLQVCFAEEARAKGAHDKAVAALELAQSALDEAIENTKTIVRATEIAERLAK